MQFEFISQEREEICLADTGFLCTYPRQYQETTSTRTVRAMCPETNSAGIFRSQFDYKCTCAGSNDGQCTPEYPSDQKFCYYEYSFLLPYEDVQNGSLIQSGNIARNNFNYRHGDLALNLVGTNLIDCGEDAGSSCYTNAFVNYTLTHSGEVDVKNHSGELIEFDMATANIQHGKALSGELLITNPMSSNQVTMIQPYLKTGFKGRPLYGSYSLKIYDDPYLNWGALQDIQFILNYRYWTNSSY
jgi:hypothetical protein